MDYSAAKELALYKKTGKALCYAAALLKEILIANLNVCRLILSEEEEIEPVLAEFSSCMETPAGQAFYANAITLTPGTITVTVEKERYLVHCLDESLAEGLYGSDLEKRLHELEG
jgi:multicomponent Na+:H+ antiporter subunit E